MARTEEVTPYYIRSASGECFYVDTLAEALVEFLGEDGYRLTLTSTRQELVIRRTGEWGQGFIDEKNCNAVLTAREKDISV